MKAVVFAFVVAFLGLSAYSLHLSRLPELECSGSAVTGFIDSNSTQGYPSIRQAVEKYLPESTERTVVARRPEDQGGGTGTLARQPERGVGDRARHEQHEEAEHGPPSRRHLPSVA